MARRDGDERTGQPQEATRPPDDPDRVSADESSADAASAPGSATAEAEAVEPEPAPDEGGGGPEGDAQEQPAEDPLTPVEAERAEYLALAQRTQADFDNYRKRAAKEIAAAGARSRVELMRELLPVIDNLERALESAGDPEAALADGVRLVLAELSGVLERGGVEAIAPAGERFDPTIHEALSTRAENGADAGLVLDVVQKGYRLDSTVLRPARVVVSA